MTSRADVMGYFSYTRAYKPGGVNDNPNAVLVPHVFENESINAFEFGSKFRSSNGAFVLNGATYYYDYQDMQYIAVDPLPFQYGIDNIPTAHIYGMELESTWRAFDERLRLDGNLSWSRGRVVGDFRTLDAKAANQLIASTPACQFGGVFFNPQCWSQMIANAPNANGNDVPKLPRWQGSLRGSYTFALGAERLMAQIEYVYRGSFQYRIFNDGALDSVPSCDQWNLYFQLVPPGGHWNYSLGISNLFNVAGINARYTDPYGTGQTSDEFIPPRQIIGTIAYHF